MDANQYLSVASYAAAGLALAACAGLRAFLPLFCVGLAGRLGRFELTPGYGWLASDPALVTFGVAVLLETLADKIPIVDHLLDAVQTVLKPAIGTIASAALFVQLPPFLATVVGLVVGGSIATGVHLAKAKIRLFSSLATGTTLNPVLSFAEDLVATVIAAVSLLAPILALFLVALLAGLVFHRVHKRWRPTTSPPAGGTPPPP